MVSEFLCAAKGRLSYWDAQQQQRVYATEIIKYGSGKGDDGWWNAEKMVEQTRKAIQVFNHAFPDDIAVGPQPGPQQHQHRGTARRQEVQPGGFRLSRNHGRRQDGRPSGGSGWG